MILVAHGERGGEGTNQSLYCHAGRLSRALPLVHVAVGLLNGRPSLEDALDEVRACGTVHVIPFLMSEGYFTDTVIPSRLTSRHPDEQCILHAPIGVSKTLTALIDQHARAGAVKLGLRPAETTVLLVGHGAKGNRRARLAIEAHAVALRQAGVFADVSAAFLEETPFLDETLAALAGPTVVVGMFVSGGLHAGEDVPEAVKQAVHVPVFYTGAIGEHPAMSDIVLEQISR